MAARVRREPSRDIYVLGSENEAHWLMSTVLSMSRQSTLHTNALAPWQQLS